MSLHRKQCPRDCLFSYRLVFLVKRSDRYCVRAYLQVEFTGLPKLAQVCFIWPYAKHVVMVLGSSCPLLFASVGTAIASLESFNTPNPFTIQKPLAYEVYNQASSQVDDLSRVGAATKVS